jgi:mannose-6-phosphate isomerase-like protein (cupin superfamily)
MTSRLEEAAVSYPPIRHTGPGTTGAIHRPAATPPELAFRRGGAASYLATQQSTGGEYGLFRWDMGQAPGGPDAHFHRTISEAFFVLHGIVLLYDGQAWLEAGPGDFLYVPPGGVHAFRNPDGEASMLMLFAPGAPRQDYFEELAALDDAARAVMSPQDWTALYARHDQYEVDGPPAPR